MAAFSETIRIVVEAVGTGKAAGEVSKLDSAMSKSGTAATGWQQNLSKVGTFIGNNLPMLVAGGAAAVVAFAAKSVTAFQDTALSAGKLADATGLTVEEASRWNEVASDVGIGTEQLGKSFGFLLKGIGKTPDAFRDLGITAKDSNGQILQAIDLLNATPAGAERAALGAKLFGRSWAEVSELVAEGAGRVKQALDEVSDAKVIDTEELQKARAYRAAMDELSDAIDDVSLSIGENLVPGLATAATGLAKLLQSGPMQEFITLLGTAAEALGEVLTNISDINGMPLPFSEGQQALVDYNNLLKDFDGSWVSVLAHYQELARTGGAGGKDALQLILDMKTAAEAADQTIGTMGLTYETAAESGKHLASASGEAAAATSVQNAAAGQAALIVEKMTADYNAAKDAVNNYVLAILAASDSQLALEQSSLNVGNAWASEQAAAQALGSAVDDTSTLVDEAAAADRNYQGAVNATKSAINAYSAQALQTAATQRGLNVDQLSGAEKSAILRGALQQLAAANPALQSAIQGTINKLDVYDGTNAQATMTADGSQAISEAGRVNSALDHAARNRTSVIHVTTAGGAIGPGGMVGMASGGPVTQGEPYMVGEQGKEWFVPKTDGYIMNASDTARMLARGGDGASIGSSTTTAAPNDSGGFTMRQESEEYVVVKLDGQVLLKAIRSAERNSR